jgi:hypothetical protein
MTHRKTEKREIDDLDPECLVYDPENPEDVAIIEEFQRLADAA